MWAFCLLELFPPSVSRKKVFLPRRLVLTACVVFISFLFLGGKRVKNVGEINGRQDVTYFILIAYSVHSLLLCRIRYVLFSRSKRATSAWHLSIGPANLNIHKQLL